VGGGRGGGGTRVSPPRHGPLPLRGTSEAEAALDQIWCRRSVFSLILLKARCPLTISLAHGLPGS
jgi:hypothetical protein